MSIKELKEKKEYLQDELYYLHHSEPSAEMYLQRRAEIEYKIASLEEIIIYEENMLPFKYTLMVFAIIAVVTVVTLLVI